LIRRHRDLKPENVLVTEFLAFKVADFGTARAKKNSDGVQSTQLGTPLYTAPEVIQGNDYNESVDVYSFGLLLIALSCQKSLVNFLGCRWCEHFGEAQIPNPNTIAFNRVLRPMWEGEWFPVSTPAHLPFAPPTVASLAMRCCAYNPLERPSFQEVLEDLLGVCASEVATGNSSRSAGGYISETSSPGEGAPLTENPMRRPGAATPGQQFRRLTDAKFEV
jgi:serine/threonine protein kinase